MMTKARWVKEGFAGQQMVVLPRPLVVAAGKHPLLRGLHVTDAGYFPEAARHGVDRARGLACVILIVCRAGRGWARLGGEVGATQAVGPGDAVLIPAGRPHAYGAEEDEPWTIQWVHFAGTEAAEWCRWLSWPAGGGVRRLRAGTPESMELGRVHEELEAGHDERSLLAAAAALRWALARLDPALAGESGEPTRLAVEAVEAWLREHSGGRVTLAELARRAGLSVPHFAALFRKRFGFSPIDYFLRLKIRRACSLLDATEWPVGRVAEEAGFEDPLYFSRRFRAVMGVSPRAYRKLPKG